MVVVWLMVVEMVAWLWYGQWLAIRWILAVGMAICGCSVAVGLAVSCCYGCSMVVGVPGFCASF